VGFIVFLYYSNLLMGEYERAGQARLRRAVWALQDIFTHSSAIRLPGNDVLQREIEPLLTRPVGRPCNAPLVRYADFSYQAQSWNRSRRVVAKVEWHKGELFPRVGFIVRISPVRPNASSASTNSGERQNNGSRKARMR
jgi:hypothetical protein